MAFAALVLADDNYHLVIYLSTAALVFCAATVYMPARLLDKTR